MASCKVVAKTEFSAWYRDLGQEEAAAVTRSVGELERVGVLLPHPYSSLILTSKHGVRELRTQAQGRPLRVFYAFDPLRQAVLLLGGDKTGDDRFYETFVPQADAIFERHLTEVADEEKLKLTLKKKK